MTIRTIAPGLIAALSLAAFAPQLAAQHLHTNDRWEECAIVLAPHITQGTFRQFTREVGLVTYFRPLVSAAPMGRRNFEVALLDWGTRIDDATPQWNDTFSHPDSTHWLFEGSALRIPGLMVRGGVTDRLDVGAYWTRSFGANYGFLGGQVQYNLVNDTRRQLAAAGRMSVVRVYGPEDVSATTYGLDLVASKAISIFEPYVGVSGYLATARETTSKVDLEGENILGARGTIGVAARVSVLRLGAEYSVAKVPGLALKAGFGI